MPRKSSPRELVWIQARSIPGPSESRFSQPEPAKRQFVQRVFSGLGFVLLGLLFSTSCGPKHRANVSPPSAGDKQSQASAPEKDQPGSRTVLEPSTPTAAPEELHDPTPSWLHDLKRLRERVKSAESEITTGQNDQALKTLQSIHNRLTGPLAKASGLPEYQSLLDDCDILHQVVLDEIDLQQSEDAADESVDEEEHEPSPLDEIGDLNLYQISIAPELESQVDQELRNSRFDIPIELNELVLKSLEYFQGPGRKVMEKGLKRSGRYIDLFRKVFSREGLPLDLIYMAQVESLFSPRAYSRARARGIWQFMSGTARLYGLHIDWWVDERSNVEKSTVAAARHLHDLYQEFQDWELTLAAYNAGPGRIRRILKRYGQMDFWSMAKRRLLPRETRNHIPSVLAAMIIFKNPESYGFEVEPDPPLEYESIKLDYQIDLRVVAEALDVDERVISDLNPFLRRGVTPEVKGGFDLRVPYGTASYLETELSKIPPDKRLRVRHYRVQHGDTLWAIAHHYGTSVRAIAEVNRLRNANRLRLGQDLIIPLSDWHAMVANGAGSEATPIDGKYRVRRGDSLYKIARRYGVTIRQLANWNNLKTSDTIYPGQQLLVSAQQ